jgi:hypothetical protein
MNKIDIKRLYATISILFVGLSLIQNLIVFFVGFGINLFRLPVFIQRVLEFNVKGIEIVQFNNIIFSIIIIVYSIYSLIKHKKNNVLYWMLLFCMMYIFCAIYQIYNFQ